MKKNNSFSTYSLFQERSFMSISGNRLKIFALALVIMITALTFLPCLSNSFVNFDDREYVENNTMIRNLSLSGIMKMFTTGYAANYHPLTLISYAIEYHFFKLNPFPYHLNNYLLHLFITALVFAFIYSLTKRLSIAFIVALLFGIHPLHVESVAWISERKDLLCALFYIGAMICYQNYVKNKIVSYYVCCFVCTIFALLSKPMAVTIPLALILLDYFNEQKINIKNMVAKLPFFAVAFCVALINFNVQSHFGAMSLGGDIRFRIYFCLKAVPFYLYKLILPIYLSAIYPYHNVGLSDIAQIKFYALFIIILLAIIIWSTKFSKKIVFGSAFFFVTLLPVLKIIPAGDAFVADRYMYIPSIGVFFIFATLFTKIIFDQRIPKIAFVFCCVFSLIVLALFSIGSWQRCHVWKNTESLYTDILNQYPDMPMANCILGCEYAKNGKFTKAERFLKKAFFQRTHKRIRTDAEKYLAGLPKVSRENGKLVSMPSDEDLKEAKQFYEIGLNRLKFGNKADAIGLLEEAAMIDPHYSAAYNQLGCIYYESGDINRSIEYFKKALAADPNSAKARENLNLVTGQVK